MLSGQKNFYFAQFGVFSLIINGCVGSFASSRMLSGQAALLKTCALLLTFFPPLLRVRSRLKSPYVPLSLFFATSIQVTTGLAAVQKENL
jgi:hypothetical protein